MVLNGGVVGEWGASLALGLVVIVVTALGSPGGVALSEAGREAGQATTAHWPCLGPVSLKQSRYRLFGLYFVPFVKCR